MNNYLDTATELASQACEIMLEHFDSDVAVNIKSDNTPVTVADESINQLVIERITAEYPTHGVVGEEASVNKPEASYQWVCDPIDGTLPYTLGIPTNVFSLALVEDGDPIVAVVADPYMKRMYTATVAGGAFCNERRLSTSTRSEFAGSIMNVSGRSGNGAAVWGGPIYADLEKLGVRMLHHSTMVYEAVLVASGAFEAAIFTKRTPWDAAAAALLVTEAGGTVTDVNGEAQRYDRPLNGTVFSNGVLHDQVQQIVARHLV